MHTTYCFIYFIALFNYMTAQEVEIVSNALGNVDVPIKLNEEDLEIIEYKVRYLDEEKVNISVYYETLCADCKYFDNVNLKEVVEKLSPYLNIRTYPYGKAKMIKTDDGKLIFECQHGPKECYGNKLHACALDKIINATAALLFNICMTDPKNTFGSDDPTADACGSKMSINSNPIKECAKGNRGDKLLQYYGMESEKIHYRFVPYVLINEKEWTNANFMKAVCEAFTTPPEPCQKFYFYYNV
ncbi:gamma-interferon-inducible lysosomal thiol reductase-like [Aphomia sociella]